MREPNPPGVQRGASPSPTPNSGRVPAAETPPFRPGDVVEARWLGGSHALRYLVTRAELFGRAIREAPGAGDGLAPESLVFAWPQGGGWDVTLASRPLDAGARGPLAPLRCDLATQATPTAQATDPVEPTDPADRQHSDVTLLRLDAALRRAILGGGTGATNGTHSYDLGRDWGWADPTHWWQRMVDVYAQPGAEWVANFTRVGLAVNPPPCAADPTHPSTWRPHRLPQHGAACLDCGAAPVCYWCGATNATRPLARMSVREDGGTREVPACANPDACPGIPF